jgi:hypothetical protein
MATNLAYALSEQDYRRPTSGATLGGSETLSVFSFQQQIVRIIDEFRSLMALPPNWDSYGARRISVWSIEAAVGLLLQVMRVDTPHPSIVPTSDGYVQIEWHTRGIDLEVEVISPALIHVAYEDHRSGQPLLELDLGSDLTEFRSFISELSSRH